MSWRTESTRSFRSRTPTHEELVQYPRGFALSSGWLTQFGTDWFRSEPRFEQEFDVSALKGRLNLQETVYAILGRKPKSHHRHRHFQVTRLVDCMYQCLDTGWARNPQHASILAGCTEEDIEAHKAWWADPGRVTLDRLAESEV